MSNAAATAGSAPADPVAAAHARMLHDPSLQFGFDSFPPPKPPHVPDWLKALGEMFKAMAPALHILFYVLIGAMILAIVFFVGRELIALRWPGIKKKRKVVAAEPDW